MKYFKLERTHTEILTTLGHDGKLKIFNSVAELIYYFVNYRLTKFGDKILYDKTKLSEELDIIEHKIKFVKDVIDDKIDFRHTTKSALLSWINSNISTCDWAKSFINIPLYECTSDQVAELQQSFDDKTEKMQQLNLQTPNGMYLAALKGV